MEKTLESLTREERSLLLYFECVSVDYSGLIDGLKINNEDNDIAKRWASEGFIEFGRVKLEDVEKNGRKSLWVTLSDNAWELAHRERRDRAKRNWSSRRWRKNSEDR